MNIRITCGQLSWFYFFATMEQMSRLFSTIAISIFAATDQTNKALSEKGTRNIVVFIYETRIRITQTVNHCIEFGGVDSPP